MDDDVRPFRVDIADPAIEDLRVRLHQTRWPEPQTVDDWSQGTPLSYARKLCRYWLEDYDWPAANQRLNQFPQFMATVDGLDIHFIHVRSPLPTATPLVLTHGWPGSVVEFFKVIGRVTDPVAHGGSREDAFHVVCPSLPGFGFSGKPTRPGWGTQRIADAWNQLMTRLGYPRYGAQGGDWGARVTMDLGLRHPDHLIGIHLNMVPVVPPRGTQDDFTEAEKAAVAALARHSAEGTGYSKEQSTRPPTVGYGLVDSPAMLAAWIVEKFHAWSDNDGDPETVISRDEMLDNIMLYWLPATGASAARIYWESFGKNQPSPIAVPAGRSIFPKRI